MQVFFSHYHREKSLVRQVAEALPAWITPWVDEDRLCFGEGLTPALKDAIESQVDYVVLFFNEDAADSAWVRKETKWALRQESRLDRTFLLPVLTPGARRERLAELDLADRLTLGLADQGKGTLNHFAHELANHIAGHMVKLLDGARAPVVTTDSLHTLGKEAVEMIARIPAEWRPRVEALLVKPFVRDLASTPIGTISLAADSYYREIFSEMVRSDAATRILAVSTLSSDLWTSDADQTHYAGLNFEAVLRGADIRRLFVVPETHPPAFREIIRRHEQAGIDTRVGATGLLARVPDLDDFVLFEADELAHAYVAQASIVGSRRISSGSVILSEHLLARKRDALEAAWEFASAPNEFFRALPSSVRPAPPEERLRSYKLDFPVVSCEEAAKARNIPLARELKTLLLQTHDRGIVAVHLPGDGTLSLRKVKTLLDTAEAYIASLKILAELGLSAGTVCAVKEPVWSMTHLVSRRLMNMDSVMTNDGTRTGYFEFNPGVLMEAVDVMPGDIEQ